MQRFPSFLGGLALEAAAGSGYAFSVYSPQVKAALNLSESDIQTVGTVGNVGSYLGLVPGLVYDAAGPQVTAGVGAALSCLGYVLMWRALAGSLPASRSMLSLYSFIWAQGGVWMDVAAVATTARNYAADRGLAMGLTKALYGLSASMLTLVYVCTYRPDVTPFIMFCAISITTFGVVGAVFNRLMPKSLSASMRRPERARMLLGYVLIFVLMLYLGIMGSLTAEGTLERAGRYAYGLIPFILLLGLSAVPITCRKQQHPSNSTLHVVNTASHKHEYLSIPSTATQRLVDGGGVNAAPSTSPLRDSLLAPPTAEGDAALSEGPHPSHRLSFAPEVLPSVSGATLLEAVSSLDFALLTAIFFLSTGAGLTLINNLGSMTQALGAQRDDQDVYVNLLSIFNCLGRLCTGSASDALLPRFPRPIWLAGCCALLAVGMAMVAVGNLDLLYPAVMCAGFAYGGIWSVGPSVAADRFGARAYAGVFAIISMSSALASYTFSAQLASSIYTRNIAPGGGNSCFGAGCYQVTFVILGILSVVAGIAAALFTRRVLRLYVGEGGRAIELEAYDGSDNALARALKAWLLPRCCCRWGRRLVSRDEVDVGPSPSSPFTPRHEEDSWAYSLTHRSWSFTSRSTPSAPIDFGVGIAPGKRFGTEASQPLAVGGGSSARVPATAVGDTVPDASLALLATSAPTLAAARGSGRATRMSGKAGGGGAGTLNIGASSMGNTAAVVDPMGGRASAGAPLRLGAAYDDNAIGVGARAAAPVPISMLAPLGGGGLGPDGVTREGSRGIVMLGGATAVQPTVVFPHTGTSLDAAATGLLTDTALSSWIDRGDMSFYG